MEKQTICKICNNRAFFNMLKKATEYYQCSNCKTIFSQPLENEGMIGGGNEEQRNLEQNADRISRIATMLGGYKNGAKILDFGCGHGMLVNDFIAAGFNAEGYDLYNDDYNAHLPKRDSFNVVTMVEVIEHTSAPFYELDVVHRCLRPGGAVYIETSFVDIAHEEGIPLEEFFYIDPSVGHSTIFSHHALDVLMITKGFVPDMHYNRHVRIFIKP